ncbi:Piso0_005162 [Millerozyma farinosa CBS 7064]|uniref:Elongator complex protein 1 n=1 Tax=Pichia sorbitophila (strain ATCC MYA-4447 / BCRC 22081 / CBS 7064 / NBRC 10061 / NRRL Y-12695) TaxID=559304 RepID=G8Y1F6_PICSO|nr:Piso0_005162 [Millerozyma farinosa CBS 7064]
MKSLVVLNKGLIQSESRTVPDLKIADAVFDVFTESISYAMISQDLDAIEVQQFTKSGDIFLLTSFGSSSGKLLSFSHFSDASQLVFVFENGDIITASYDPSQPDADTTIIEIVGSIDVGIQAAKWSVDEEILVLVTNDNKVVMLSRLFEPINEKTLNPDDIRISDSKHISVGWGKKETQFKGRGAKALEREKQALLHAGLDLQEDTPLRDPTVSEAERGVLSQNDTFDVNISWRGDCEYFSVSTVETVVVEDTQETFDRRVIRVFTRDGELDSVSEPVDGLEYNLSWKPQGSLIASTQRHIDQDGDEVLDLVFYERNGLRHGQFDTRLNPADDQVIDLQWSSDSEILAFHLKDRVQLWTTKNYHWYLKQEIWTSSPSDEVSFVRFHPEKPLHLMIGTSNSELIVVDLATTIITGPTQSGLDTGMVMVTDGSIAKITPLSIANVPPPIAYRELEVGVNISDMAVNKYNDKFAVLSSKGSIHVSQMSIDEMQSGKQINVSGTLDCDIEGTSFSFAKQIAFLNDHILVLASDSRTASSLTMIDTTNPTTPIKVDEIMLNSKVVLLKSTSNYESVSFQCIDGTVHTLDSKGNSYQVCKFPQVCKDFQVAPVKTTEDESEVMIAFGLASNAKLYLNEKQIATAVTSIQISESHLLFTTALSHIYFIHLKNCLKASEVEDLVGQFKESNDERKRLIERGSIIVSLIPSRYAVILEAPRGNLETIYPRIMVLGGVRESLSKMQYKEAFLACRTHRIDLDILHDFDPESFLQNIEVFVKQIEKVEYLDLFVSCLHEDNVAITKYRDTVTSDPVESVFSQMQIGSGSHEKDVTNQKNAKGNGSGKSGKHSKINKICDAILKVLLNDKYFEKYLQTIITAYACQKPPNLLDALRLIGTFSNNESIDQTITHLCFLSDPNKLYDCALELYDVKLTLTIAQHTQKDPKEYLPFLQNLYSQSPLRRQFLIDDYLKYYEKALDSLYHMGEDAYDEFDTYMMDHSLYKKALTIYKDDSKRSYSIMRMFAEHLHDIQQYVDSALTYEYLQIFDLALENYVIGKRWKEAFAILHHSNDSEKLLTIGENLVNALVEEHKYSDAADIEYHFLKKTEHAVELYCKNYDFDNAILIAYKENSKFLESVIDPQLNESFGTIAELLADCKGQINSQLRRLRELRQKKEEEPHNFYGTSSELDTPDDVSIAQTETSVAPSFFTRYTGKTAGTAKTGVSRRTVKNKKREERKRAKGRKGTIYEEEYLIRSIGRLIERLNNTENDAVRLLEGLLRRGMKEKAYIIQKNWQELVTILKDCIDEVYSMSEKDRERIDDNGELYYIPEIEKPVIREFPSKPMLDY